MNTMRHPDFEKIILLLLTSLFSSCEKPSDYYIVFVNNSDKTVMISHNYAYPKDSLVLIKNMLSQPCRKVNPKSSVRLTTGGVKLSSWYQSFYFSQTEAQGYVSFCMIEDKVRTDDEKESLIKEYDILARYDVTQDDIESLHWTLEYPPSKEMQAIHMFPPFDNHILKEE